VNAAAELGGDVQQVLDAAEDLEVLGGGEELLGGAVVGAEGVQHVGEVRLDVGDGGEALAEVVLEEVEDHSGVGVFREAPREQVDRVAHGIRDRAEVSAGMWRHGAKATGRSRAVNFPGAPVIRR